MQHFALIKQERDQQTTDSSIAVKEGMNRFELSMRQAALGSTLEVTRHGETFQLVERPLHFRHRRRHDGRRSKISTCGSDPLLSSSKLSWVPVSTSDTVKKLRVNFSNQAQTQRQCVEALDSIVHRADVIDNFFNVFRYISTLRVHLELEHILQGALSSFDLRAKALPPDERTSRRRGRDLAKLNRCRPTCPETGRQPRADESIRHPLPREAREAEGRAQRPYGRRVVLGIFQNAK